jgi:putative membrane protein
LNDTPQGLHSLLFLPEQVPYVMTAMRLESPGVSRGSFFCATPQWPASALASAAHNQGMSTPYLWVKALHIIFVASWFAGLFYLPRLFVNLAMVPSDSHAERERLLLMARKLYRFSTLLMIPALVLGLLLWLYFGMGKGPGQIWLHLKLTLVIGAIGYHHVCRKILRDFEGLQNRRSHRWFRVFNEIAVVLFAAIVILVVLKPTVG